MASAMRVAVLGRGGVGGLLGALLSRDGHEVTCLARPATCEHLREHGLTLRSTAFGDFRVRVGATSRLTEPVDVVLVTVKATHLDSALGLLPTDTLGDALVVPFLNGLEHPSCSARSTLRTRLPPPPSGSRRSASLRVSSTIARRSHSSSWPPGRPIPAASRRSQPRCPRRVRTWPFGRTNARSSGTSCPCSHPELDAIGGSILRAARAAGTPAPVTARMVAGLEHLAGGALHGSASQGAHSHRTSDGRPVGPQ